MTAMTVIVDLQFGSTGKGLIAGYLSQKKEFDTVVSANMPNAGHTFVDARGKKWINKVLPSGLYSPSLTYVGIGPGAVFDPAQLVKEIDEMRERINTDPQILIHECAAILLPEHKEAEQKLNPIASTMQGSAEACIQKMRREGIGSNVAGLSPEYLGTFFTNRGEPLTQFLVTSQQWFDLMLLSDNILCEGSQGYSLGINAGFYPYATSRDCTVNRLLSDCALPPTSLKTVVGTARVHPIRVGNTNGGNSGPHYRDQVETSWSEIGVEPEMTTVTGRVRRVFTFSEMQVREAMTMNAVDRVFLNFCNYEPAEAIRVAKIINAFGSEVYARRGLGAWAGDYHPQVVRYLGFGPKAEHIMEVDGYTG
jgi:adenylosuccinate synthase